MFNFSLVVQIFKIMNIVACARAGIARVGPRLATLLYYATHQYMVPLFGGAPTTFEVPLWPTDMHAPSHSTHP